MNRQQQLEYAANYAEQFYGGIKRTTSRKDFNRLDLDDLKQEAQCFVLECYADERMADRKFLRKQLRLCLLRWLYRELKISENELQIPEDDEGTLFDPEDNNPFANPADQAVLNEVLSTVATLPVKRREAISGMLNHVNGAEMARGIGISRQASCERRRNAIFSLRSRLGVVA